MGRRRELSFQHLARLPRLSAPVTHSVREGAGEGRRKVETRAKCFLRKIADAANRGHYGALVVRCLYTLLSLHSEGPLRHNGGHRGVEAARVGIRTYLIISECGTAA